MASSPERRNRFAPTRAVTKGVEASRAAQLVDQRLPDQTQKHIIMDPVPIEMEQKPTEFVTINRFYRRILPK